MNFLSLFRHELSLSQNNHIRAVFVSAFSMLLLWMVTTPSTFEVYSDALPIAFALANVSILIGLNLSGSTTNKSFNMNDIPPLRFVFACMLSNVVISVVLSAILTLPYLLNLFRISGQNTLYLYFAVFVTIVSSSAVGLFVFVILKNKPNILTLLLHFIMLFQFLFSGFIFEQIQGFDRFTMSKYSVRAIGSGMRFDNEYMLWDTPPFAFENSLEHIIENLGLLLVFCLIFTLASIAILLLEPVNINTCHNM